MAVAALPAALPESFKALAARTANADFEIDEIAEGNVAERELPTPKETL